MTICPVAIAVGCQKCPVFKVCPVKGVIGDYKPAAKTTTDSATKAAGGSSSKAPARKVAKSTKKATSRNKK